MEWNVYYHSINSKEIKTFNIFNHGGFNQDVEKYLSNCIESLIGQTYNNLEIILPYIKEIELYYIGKNNLNKLNIFLG